MAGDKFFQKRKAELTRRQNIRPLRRFLIVCEGEKIEPNYFKAFPENPEVYDAIDIYGTGYNTVSLVNEAIRLKKKAQDEKEPYIEVWCVFDRDSFPIEQFSNAITLAKSNQIRCAYSIEAFELWYLIHFNYYDSALSREQYKDKLSELLKKQYQKNDPGMYKLLEKKQPIAIQNAQKLFINQYKLPLREQNPVTTVFELVTRLADRL
ncbi:hypothetical protein FACS189447_06940 [Spirochaetia bacterium]|nr:hypothetical protein FACS189447_06940 [Spirochaetia bacterium]